MSWPAWGRASLNSTCPFSGFPPGPWQRAAAHKRIGGLARLVHLPAASTSRMPSTWSGMTLAMSRAP
eukprot:8044455-Lingulodinium_polyedra.AAC.1